MYFKNLQLYRLPEPWNASRKQTEEALFTKRFSPCGNHEMESSGFVYPVSNARYVSEEDFIHHVGFQWLICLQTERRILPSSVINEEADKRALAIEHEQGFKPGRKQMKELREQVTLSLMPKAFTKRSKTYAWIDPVGGWLVVDSPSQSKADYVIEVLRHCIDDFPLTLPRIDISPAYAMADWLAAGEAPKGFTIDQDCTVQSVTDDRKTVTYKNGLDDEQIREHLEARCLPVKLAMTFDDRISFVMTDKLEIKRLKFLDVVRDQVSEDDDAQELFDAEFALMTGELSRLIASLVNALGGEVTPKNEGVEFKEAA